MTEKLLLYGGALQQAGAVRQKAEQRATQSDFMEMEKERGISISSTVMNFDYHPPSTDGGVDGSEGPGLRINILDTPGHQDFSEDTYVMTNYLNFYCSSIYMCHVRTCFFPHNFVPYVIFKYPSKNHIEIWKVPSVSSGGQCCHAVRCRQGVGTTDTKIV